MNEDPIEIFDERIPDFTWPDHIAEFLSEWLSAQWKTLVEQYAAGFFRRRIPRMALQTAFWSCIVYIGLLWVCLCYVYYPVSPYGVWDFVKWVAIVAAGTLVAAYTLYGGVYGGITIALLLYLLLALTVYFALSLLYLCWQLWSALRKGSPSLRRYRSAMFIGMAACLLVATFVDGSYRFWDQPFEVRHWATLVFVAASAWAALFCVLVRDKGMERGKPRSVLKWTVGFAIGITLFAYWGASGQKTEYFLRKKVMQVPKDPNAWLELGWHYSDEGNKLADDPGDETHAAPDPTPLYSEALECLNQAVSLGAGGYEVQMARAQLADAIGEKQDAVSFGREALNLAPAPSDSSSEEEMKWLREMISRNAAAPRRKNDRIRQVRDERRQRLPGILRFWFEAL
jgi:tetratricopeptide (TPR) repeat protein